MSGAKTSPFSKSLGEYLEEKFSGLAKITSNVKLSGSEDVEIEFFNNFDFNGLVLVIKIILKKIALK